MANDTSSIGFFAAEVLERTAQRQPQKTAIIAKEEELTFATLNQRVHALAAHLHQEGVRQGDRVGMLLANSTVIPLSYYAGNVSGNYGGTQTGTSSTQLPRPNPFSQILGAGLQGAGLLSMFGVI